MCDLYLKIFLNLRNNDLEDALFFLIYFNNLTSTCFEMINCSSSGVLLLYVQHIVFIMHLSWLAALTTHGVHNVKNISQYCLKLPFVCYASKGMNKTMKWGAEWSILLTQYCSGDKTEKNETGGACSVYGGKEKSIQGFGGETWGKETIWEIQSYVGSWY
jgi:hypothetical protein